MDVATMEEIFRPASIDMWWAVILNEAKRNEESHSSVATMEEILRPENRDSE